ncbi:hypothetical protein ILYODFUR_012191 [Ilyodon furcidens]|uniref:Secreted protein n=1 Tax=Ilyodon furcidens TaxID=33524 RepID=A0ABV0UTI8_9TELE
MDKNRRENLVFPVFILILSASLPPPTSPCLSFLPFVASTLNSAFHPLYLRKTAVSFGKTAGLGGKIMLKGRADSPLWLMLGKEGRRCREQCSGADKQIWTGQQNG